MRSPGNRTPRSKQPLSGIDRFLADRQMPKRMTGRRIGLLTNHACTTADGRPVVTAMRDAVSRLAGTQLVLLAPEHGMWPVARAGARVEDETDPLTALAVHSLYRDEAGDVRLDGIDIDVLVIDLRDVGVRCFTYAATAARAARNALQRGIDVIVCDRMNPLGPAAAGPRPDTDKRSLLAFFDVPFIHGLTLGALAERHAAPVHGAAVLDIYPADVDPRPPLGWVPPSPALSHPDAVAAYGGLVLLEATNASEGRGTSVSFRSVSAPGLDNEGLGAALNSWGTGFTGRAGPVVHTRGPHAGETLPGVVIWPRSTIRPDPLALGVHILAWLRRHYRAFAWRTTTTGSHAIDALFARADLREQIEGEAHAEDILAGWRTQSD